VPWRAATSSPRYGGAVCSKGLGDAGLRYATRTTVRSVYPRELLWKESSGPSVHGRRFVLHRRLVEGSAAYDHDELGPAPHADRLL
jgi:hypothetical protein